jgi:hypothetical protein
LSFGIEEIIRGLFFTLGNAIAVLSFEMTHIWACNMLSVWVNSFRFSCQRIVEAAGTPFDFVSERAFDCSGTFPKGRFDSKRTWVNDKWLPGYDSNIGSL